MHILLVGSNGQIGTNLALRLLENGHQVFGIDKRPNIWTDKFPYLLQDLTGKFSHFAGGIGAVPYPKDIDIVVHFAANAKVHELVIYPQRAIDNIQITFNVLEYCRANRLPIIFASSREVYGDIHRYEDMHEANSNYHFTESPYSASKIAGEALIYSYARCYNIPYLVFRFSNVYGRYDSDIERMERVIPLFVKKIYNEEPITIFGKDKILDFTYVDDCIDGVFSGIEKLYSRELCNETINLAKGEGHTLIEMATFIAKYLRKKIHMSIEDSKIGEITHYIADISKAKKLLQYNPTTTLEDGIQKYIQWWKKFYQK